MVIPFESNDSSSVKATDKPPSETVVLRKMLPSEEAQVFVVAKAAAESGNPVAGFGTVVNGFWKP
jgi:hypothetical protein